MTDDHGHEEDYDLFSGAAALLDAGMAGAALDTLAPAFEDPRALEPELGRTLELLARSFAAIDARPLEAACRDAARDPTDAETLHRLGFQLVEYRRPAMAAAMLALAHARAPRNPAILEELARSPPTRCATCRSSWPWPGPADPALRRCAAKGRARSSGWPADAERLRHWQHDDHADAPDRVDNDRLGQQLLCIARGRMPADGNVLTEARAVDDRGGRALGALIDVGTERYQVK